MLNIDEAAVVQGFDGVVDTRSGDVTDIGDVFGGPPSKLNESDERVRFVFRETELFELRDSSLTWID
ncbi:hypothetical protein C447_00195 [Halococcus hamelinensis 100A6]|uniref:Uncharacterized protein n=1 Tax=Halococcus hamelinensis 100A6 TaxID=1132509 RepID=M0M9E9_9EURY|nr:hypothetical protein C447_00195 [Halococcus hamelinensis 100A6]